MKTTTARHLDTPTKLVVRVLQDLVAAERFDSYADLAEALKLKCARLKIPYHAGLIADAIDQLERGGKTPLISRPAVRRGEERAPEPVIIDRQFAAQFLAELGYRVRTIPTATWRDPEQIQAEYEAARERACEMGIELSLEAFLR